MSNQYRYALQATLVTVLCVVGASVMADDNDRGREHSEGRNGHAQLDARHGHNRYYPPVGTSLRSLPRGYYTTPYRGVPYYFRDGIWYRRGGLGFSVVLPPVGAFVTVLPPYYTTVWFGGIPFYYADNVYYRWDGSQSGYIVSEPPTNRNDTSSGPAINNELFVYPKNAQSAEQLAKDRYDCHRWAADQTTFDPTKAGADNNQSKREDYKRAQATCLDARGYSVK